MNYDEFIKRKERSHVAAGFEAGILNPLLKPFQKFSVTNALQKGRFALFADCGTGKTFMQLEWAGHVVKHTRKPVLILAPLAVVEQTIKEGGKFGIIVKDWNENTAGNTSFSHLIFITNYEQLPHVDCSLFSGVVLDESSVLKNHEGAYRNMIIERFRNTPYKLCCTATPSPNDPMELGNHSEFLGLMTRSEMLATHFVHDGGETAKWRLKGHAIDKFWRWVNTWSLMFSKPSDIGFEDEGYILPELNFIEKQIATPQREGKLFNDVSVSATNFNQELRLTKLDRMSEAISLVNSSTENFIIWIKHNDEGEYLKKCIPGAVEVTGGDKPEYKKDKLLGFAKGDFRVLITKTDIAAMGLNYQNCHNQIFASLDFSFESLYQGIRRSYRFGQLHPVNIYLITIDTMQNVIASIKNKEAQFLEMQQQMIKHTKQLYHESYNHAA